jgi:hypothetical protein
LLIISEKKVGQEKKKIINYDEWRLVVVGSKTATTFSPKHHLELLFFQAVFKAHENRRGDTINVTIFHHSDHAIAVHRFAGEELEILEATENVLHDCVAICFEDIDLIR